MFKNSYKLIRALLLSVVVCGTAFSANYKEGEDYRVVKGIASKGNDVTEYFSFYCPACYRQEPIMAQIKAGLAEGVSFNKSPVTGLPGRNVNIESLLSRVYVMSKAMGVDDKIVPAIFNEIHVNKNFFKTEADVEAFIEQQGVDVVKAKKLLKSFSVAGQAKRMAKNNTTLKSQGITGVPSIVVNGKYKALTTNVKSVQDYQALVNYLLTLPM